MQNRFLAVDNQRMAGIVSALKTNYRPRLIGQQVHNFPFAFVTPLGADNNDILTHIQFQVLVA